MEKLWLWATSGARLKEKCCLWPISSLSIAEMVSMIWIPWAKTSPVSDNDVQCRLNYIQLHSVQTYLPRHCRLTHEYLVVGRELWRVVIHIFDSDVDTDFGVLMMAACTQTHRPRFSCVRRSSLIKNGFWFVLFSVCACLASGSHPQLTMNHFQGYLSIRAS